MGDPPDDAEPGSRNSAWPIRGPSVGFTRTSLVVHPPPTAKCGRTTAALGPVVTKGETGNVVIRNSFRSFVRPRSATTETLCGDVKVKLPSTVLARLNGGWFRNPDIWRFGPNT